MRNFLACLDVNMCDLLRDVSFESCVWHVYVTVKFLALFFHKRNYSSRKYPPSNGHYNTHHVSALQTEMCQGLCEVRCLCNQETICSYEYMKITYENCVVKNYMKEDHRSYRRNFCSVKRKPERKFRLVRKFEPLTSLAPVQRSCQLS